VNIRYNGNEIHCPYKGQCTCLMCEAPPPKRVSGPGGGGKATAGLPKNGGGNTGPVVRSQQKPGPVGGGPVIRNSGGPSTNANFTGSGGRSTRTGPEPS
jgi:hypothetical protein